MSDVSDVRCSGGSRRCKQDARQRRFLPAAATGPLCCGQAQSLHVELKRATGATIKTGTSREQSEWSSIFGEVVALAAQSRLRRVRWAWPPISDPRKQNIASARNSVTSRPNLGTCGRSHGDTARRGRRALLRCPRAAAIPSARAAARNC